MRLRDKVVFVTGISGTAGGKIATKCLREGARVKGLIRNKEQVPFCNKLGITPIFNEM